MVRLGRRSLTTGRLTKAAMDRGIRTLRTFKSIAERHGAEISGLRFSFFHFEIQAEGAEQVAQFAVAGAKQRQPGLQRLANTRAALARIDAVRPDDYADIMFTSGTTGLPKGCMLTHANLLSNALVLKDYWGWRTPEQGGDVLIHALPIFHVHGLFVATHGALLNGSPMIWFSKFDPRAVIARFAELSKALLVRIMTEPKNSIYNQFREIFKNEGVELSIGPKVFEQIAEIAMETDTLRNDKARAGETIREISDANPLAAAAAKLPDADSLKAAMKGHVLGEGELVGTHQR